MASSSQHQTPRFGEVVDKILKLTEIENKELKKQISDHLQTLVEQSKNEDSKLDVSDAESWLRFAQNETHLKIVTADVPTGILPKGLDGTLLDVKVFTRRGPDDEIYDNNKKIRAKVARGNCFLQLSGQCDGEARVSCVLQGLKKFTGGLGDDDDRETGDNHTWKRYFTKSFDAVDSIIATRKANGEAAHVSCRLIGGNFILCGGSKNVHMLFRKKEDIKLYAEPRFRIAREVCETVMDYIDQMEPEQKDNLLKFLAFSRYTGVFEILSPDHQHVEDLSHLKQPLLQFITWTRCDLNPVKGDELGAIPPNVGIEIARALGLQTVSYEVVPLSKLEDHMKEIRQGYQFEGEVLYFLDNKACVMGLLKKKTVWYIMCRAIREKLRGACGAAVKYPDNFSVKKTVQKTEKRLKEIQSWLGLGDGIIVSWKTLAEKFLKWSMGRYEKGVMKAEDVAVKFPVIWKNFLADSGESDNFGRKIMEDMLDIAHGSGDKDLSGTTHGSEDVTNLGTMRGSATDGLEGACGTCEDNTQQMVMRTNELDATEMIEEPVKDLSLQDNSNSAGIT